MNIEMYDGDILLAPCDCVSIHQTNVEVYCPTIEFKKLEGGDGNPSPYRQGLRIHFVCECCDDIHKLAIYQHKGSTIMEWEE